MGSIGWRMGAGEAYAREWGIGLRLSRLMPNCVTEGLVLTANHKVLTAILATDALKAMKRP